MDEAGANAESYRRVSCATGRSAVSPAGWASEPPNAEGESTPPSKRQRVEASGWLTEQVGALGGAVQNPAGGPSRTDGGGPSRDVCMTPWRRALVMAAGERASAHDGGASSSGGRRYPGEGVPGSLEWAAATRALPSDDGDVVAGHGFRWVVTDVYGGGSSSICLAR